MLTSAVFLFLAAARVVSGASSTHYPKAPPGKTIEPSLSQIEATEATATPLSPKSDAKGVAFDRFVQVWLENTVCPLTVTFQHTKLMTSPGLQCSLWQP